MLRFLKTSLFLLILLTSGTARADTFVFSDIGIAIDTPEGWAVLSAAEGAEFLSDTNVKKEFKEMAQDAVKTQVLSIIRENPPKGVSPGIFINYWPGQVNDITGGLRNVEASLRQNVPGFELLTGPTRDDLGEFTASFIRYKYELTSNGSTFKAVEKFWLIPMGDNYLTISTGVAIGEGAAARETIERSVHSLRKFP